MNIPYNGGEFVCSIDKLNYQDVLDDFKNAKEIRILTYNISQKNYSNKLIDELKKVKENVDVQIITNIPSRFPNYYNNNSGKKAKTKYQKNLEAYLEKLNPEDYRSNPYVAFNFSNHAKIIGTDNIVYIGSANYSDESKNNIESGTLIRDKSFIQKLYREVFPNIIDESTPYFDDDFNILRLFIISMQNKFSAWLNKFDEDVLWENSHTNQRRLANYLRLDTNDLEELESDLYELRSIEGLIENTYSEDDVQYNNTINEIEDDFTHISVGWMLDFVTIDSAFYDLITYDIDDRVNEILQEYPDAYDENLEYYTELSMDNANDEYEQMKYEIEDDVIFFRNEIFKIIGFLIEVHDKIIPFSKEWIKSKIDNT